jgi:superfamily II DNA or RNA helicase
MLEAAKSASLLYPGPLNLRPYQLTAVEQIRQAYRIDGHRSVLFVLPTGGGKTVVFSHIAEQAAARGNRICVLVHRQELLRQASASLSALGVRHGLIAANRSMDLSSRCRLPACRPWPGGCTNCLPACSSCW